MVVVVVGGDPKNVISLSSVGVSTSYIKFSMFLSSSGGVDGVSIKVVEWDKVRTKVVEWDKGRTKVVEWDKVRTKVVEWDKVRTKVVEWDKGRTR